MVTTALCAQTMRSKLLNNIRRTVPRRWEHNVPYASQSRETRYAALALPG